EKVAWSKLVDSWGSVTLSHVHDIPDTVVEMAHLVLGFPGLLGIHPGGLVLRDRRVGVVAPMEHAALHGRSVVQW
ncbi:hypothetical protein ACEN85_19990, partial [Curtobacterium sp. CT11-45]|uniref:hypothetical protein n=1 Tax=Curtobacterium sp. CT11-45 TaxID=3243037 RepID=UPI0039AE9700